MCGGYPVVYGSGIDLATGIHNDFPNFEVRDQRSVIGVEQSRAAHQGKRQDVFVV